MKHKTLFRTLLVLAALAVNASLAAGAARGIAVVFTVNSTVDATDATAGDGVCETALGNGICTLRAAIQETNALPGDDAIVLPSGIYTVTIAGAGENAAAAGDLDIRDNLTITGAGSANTIIDGNRIDRVFDVRTYTPRTASLSGLTVRNGDSGLWAGAGGIWIAGDDYNQTLNLTDVSVLNNRAGDDGGGIANDGGTLVLANVAVVGNTGQDGGGIYNGGVLTITSSTIASNVSNMAGGGVYHDIYAPATISNTIVFGNSAGRDGGGILLWNGGTLTIDGSAVMNNTSAVRGGGIRSSGWLTLTNSTIAFNLAADNGGGISSDGYWLAISNSTISHNRTLSDGGGIWVSGIINMNNTTITGNYADDDGDGWGIGGGAYFAVTEAAVRNTIIAGNTDRRGEGPDCFGSFPSQDYNLIQNPASCFIHTVPLGHDRIGLNPDLGPLQDNGGPTLTHALLFSSPAVDAGNNATCATSDQRGSLRPVDGDADGNAICDIGAFENGTIAIHRVHLPAILRNP